MLQTIVILFDGLVWIIEILFFLLDLNYWFVSSIVSLLYWIICFIFNLPGTIISVLLQLWNTLHGFIFLTEVFAEQSVDIIVHSGLGVLENIKLVWNFMCQMLFLTGELLLNGMLNIAVSAQTLFENFCKIVCFTGSLPVYLFNSLGNVCYTASQNVLSAAIDLWISMGLVAPLLSQLFYGVISLTVFLLTPFLVTLDGLVSVGRVVGLLLFRNLYMIIIFLSFIFICWVIYKPTPRIRQWLIRARQICGMALAFLYSVLNSDVWRSVIAKIRMYRTALVNLRPRRENPPVRPARMQNNAPIRAQNPPVRSDFQLNAVINRFLNSRPSPNISLHNSQPAPVRENCSQDPWNLLKQQEESRKCVICQDETKTVLLLPCRHLCLCASCTQTLLQQPIFQRNCPLCRQMILQTLNVYL